MREVGRILFITSAKHSPLRFSLYAVSVQPANEEYLVIEPEYNQKAEAGTEMTGRSGPPLRYAAEFKCCGVVMAS